MITKESFKKVLEELGFKQEKNTYSKTINSQTMRVDFEAEKLVYPQGLITESDTTSNFSQNENFVVFECVHRLLQTGYKAEDLVLEKTWKLGHSGKSGRADITIYKGEEVYCIIECKTMGKEFDNAKKDLFNDSEGNQLFSYAAQARSVKWLCLYASDYKDEKIITKEEIIKFEDDKNISDLKQKDDSILTFEKASGASDFFKVWEETYNKKTYEGLIFKSKAYDIGILPLYKKDLKEFEKGDGLNVKFKEILRHNNISDPQNAFNSLLALFLCKCVDETSKRDDEELDFYYNPFKDNYFSLYKRLLDLFIKGMRDFLNEDVYHTEDNFVANALQNYIGKNRKKLQGILEKELQKARIYSAQFFNFKQSYNEKLFEKNGKVLAEVIQLFEKYRFSYSSKYQFLGELFEQFLNEGFKEDEGRYFTPMPITRFMWNALPFEDFINPEAKKFPKVIDFACGAGHFLTEGVSALSDYCQERILIDDNTLSENFYGIDKDDRLARTTQVAMLLNGAGRAKIRFIDGLEYDKEFYGDSQQIFDILVANPPYSVKDFKQHLSQNILKGKDGNIPYEVLELTSLNSAMIENIFVERLTHILKPKGLAAIILPSSILSNTDQATIKAREIILSNFNIHAIGSFGNQTFGTTGTNTIILFMSRFDEPPKKTDILQDSIDAIFANEMDGNFTDNEILESYLAMQGISKEDYLALLNQERLPSHPIFAEYKNAFENLNDTRKYKDSKSFKALSKQEQEEEMQGRLFDYILDIEREKLKFFALTYRQKTLIIKAPDKTDEQKKFLGYVISKSKNSNNGLSEEGGLLSDKENRNAQDKIAYAIKQSFKGKFHNHESFSQYVAYVKTCNLLNFSNVEFNKTISLNTGQDSTSANLFADSKYELVKLGELIIEGPKSKIKVSDAKENTNGKYPFYTSGLNIYRHDEALVKGKNIYLSTGGNAIVQFYDGVCAYSTDTYAIKSTNEDRALTKLLFYLLRAKTDFINEFLFRGMSLKHLQKQGLKNIKIPLPPLEIQEKIVKECEEVEKITTNTNDLIRAYEDLIQAVLFKAEITTQADNSDLQSLLQTINDLELNLDSKSSFSTNKLKSLLDTIPTTPKEKWETHRLSDRQKFEIRIGKRVLKNEVKENGEIPVYSANVKEIFGYVDREILKDYDKDNILWGIDGDWMVNFMPQNTPFYPTDHCGFLRVRSNKINTKILGFALEQAGSNKGFCRALRASIDRVKSLQIPLPPLKEQEQIVKIIDSIEERKQSLQNMLPDIESKMQDILQKYLF